MTPLDIPLFTMKAAEEPTDGPTLTSSTESIQKLSLDDESAPAGQSQQTVTVSATATRLADLVAERPADLLAARLLRQRPQLADLRVLHAVSGRDLFSATLAGRAGGARPLVVTLQGTTEISEVDCGCEPELVCGPHSRAAAAAAHCGSLQVLLDRSQPRQGGTLLRRLLDGCDRLAQLHLRLGSWRDLRVWQEGRVFATVRQLAVTSNSACCDIHALSQLFPELRQLRLTREAERREERCTCRFRATTLLPRLETVELQNVCPTATAAVRAYAKSLHTLKLKSCRLTSPSCEYLNSGDYRGSGQRGFRDIIQAILRRKLITLPNIQIRRLEVTNAAIDVALINRNFPCLKSLEMECGELTAETEKATSAPLWFPCLERLAVRLNGSDSAEPCILARPLPRLTEYQQSFGSLRLTRLAAACPRLERLSLDPVLLEDEAELPALRHLLVSWCGSEALAQMTLRMPALEQVRVLEPPHLEKRSWMGLEEELGARHVQLTLEW
ncbi:hypothetical protein FJT64_008502 [Amphibalanus amphitrite]|uniref:Uncharacterized protein n=1 Tax=Amphibalanus amphitrite TaxID=1232801 RepID=A0A6A4VQB4_AMPAM|nr:hypothetical protein FJT64_008502 [Amphibalanus amphitrite]